MVRDFIARTMFKRFEWGACDCLLWPADLVWEKTGIDPARNYRGTYSSWIDCRRLLTKEGGVLNLARKNMALRTRERVNGVCIVKYMGRATGGVLSGGVAHMKTPSGVIKVHQPEIIEGWGF